MPTSCRNSDSMNQRNQITKLVKEAARDAGFELVGVAPVDDFSKLDRFRDWITAPSRTPRSRTLPMPNEVSEGHASSFNDMFAMVSVAPWCSIACIAYGTIE